MNKFGMIRVTTVSPDIEIMNIDSNTEKLINIIREEEEKQTDFIVFPEKSLEGNTCGDLINQTFAYEKIEKNISKISKFTEGKSISVILGTTIHINAGAYSCGVLIQKGKICGIVPKIDNRKIYDELCSVKEINIGGEKIPFGELIFWDDESKCRICLEIGNMSSSEIESELLEKSKDVDIIFNLCSEVEIINSSRKRKIFAEQRSEGLKCAYVMCSSGTAESVTDNVFSGHHIFAEVGEIIREDKNIIIGNKITTTDLDLDLIKFKKRGGNISKINRNFINEKINQQEVKIEIQKNSEKGIDLNYRKYEKFPLVPDKENFEEVCRNAYEIQTVALARRMKSIGAKKCIIGISGGLDSTLAVLVSIGAMNIIGKKHEDVVTITMPGFGTTGKTHENACKLMELLSTDKKEISIKNAVENHFMDINHDIRDKNITFENAQARERTQILMDIANEENGIVIGTGDLSEAILGWCTFNGDHMAMYSVNGGVSKTFIRSIIRWFVDYKLKEQGEEDFSSNNEELCVVLKNILDTPISPELLPPDEKGNIKQKTEETVGPYEIHDFFIHYTINCGFTPKKLMNLAEEIFNEEYEKEQIKNWLKIFYRRFFTQQFKRNCAPEGPQVTNISLSPRAGLQMVSDLNCNMWINEIE